MPPRSPRKRVAQVLSDDGPSGDDSDSSSHQRTEKEYAAAIKPVTARPPPFRSAVFSEESKHDFHSRFLRELHEGFNLLFYGFGSKRQYLNDFATERCARLGHVVIANGFHPGFGMKDSCPRSVAYRTSTRPHLRRPGKQSRVRLALARHQYPSSYDFELSFADRTSIRGAHGIKASDTGTSSAVAMTETAALHILASVTQKAKKLFKLMGERQLGMSDSESGQDMQQAAIEYDALFSLARDNFVATNDTALRALLGEFKDHGLVLTAPSSAAGGQALWIPLRNEKLSAVLGSAQMR
ncbi:Origin recognition complex [Salix suchowensis]|nr:Origin recognition complex [Salix suchowensis]